MWTASRWEKAVASGAARANLLAEGDDEIGAHAPGGLALEK
jgi:hypothetical protein